MTLTNFTQEDRSELGWWIEIVTAVPCCTYYFGPFASQQEADAAQVGYSEDLRQEGAYGITIQIKRCQPRELTTCRDDR